MSSKPPITVSALDVERLNKLLDALAPGQFPQQALLQDELARATVVAPADLPANVVSMNSRVRFGVQPGGREYEMTLVYPRDADGSADKESVFAPVGAALLGLSVGDHIDWPSPGGESIDVKILDIVYQPERAGELHR